MYSFPIENVHAHTKKLKFILEMIQNFQSHKKGPIYLMDFGCSNGTAVSQFLIQENIIYYGIDFHTDSLSYAREHYGKKTAIFLDNIPTNLCFDIIVYSDVLEHLEYPVNILKEHRKQLKEEGIILGAIPNGYGSYENENRFEKIFKLSANMSALKKKFKSPNSAQDSTPPYNWDSGHLQFFTKSSLISTLDKSGYEIKTFRNGAFLGGIYSGHLIKGDILTKLNAKISDYLHYSMVSTWYFTAQKKEIIERSV